MQRIKFSFPATSLSLSIILLCFLWFFSFQPPVWLASFFWCISRLVLFINIFSHMCLSFFCLFVSLIDSYICSTATCIPFPPPYLSLWLATFWAWGPIKKNGLQATLQDISAGLAGHSARPGGLHVARWPHVAYYHWAGPSPFALTTWVCLLTGLTCSQTHTFSNRGWGGLHASWISIIVSDDPTAFFLRKKGSGTLSCLDSKFEIDGTALKNKVPELSCPRKKAMVTAPSWFHPLYYLFQLAVNNAPII